jgi:hypothetical protein
MTTPPPAPAPAAPAPPEPPPGGLDAERPDGPPRSPDTPKADPGQQCATSRDGRKCLL